nr:hypothetical protein [Tanacetum cinerariifolium]
IITEASQHPEWFQIQKKPPTPDHDWNKTLPATHRNIQPWISDLAKQADSCSSFNELMDTLVDFSAFLMNRLTVDTLTPELLAGPTYELMKGSCKSLVELEFFLEEVYKATTDQLDWNNPEGQQYPHNLLKPLPLIPNSRGRHVIPFDHFINNDLKYLRDAGNPIKEILLKLNLPDHRKLKDGGKGTCFQLSQRFIAACSYPTINDGVLKLKNFKKDESKSSQVIKSRMAKNILIASILSTGAKDSSKSVPSSWRYPLITRRVLFLMNVFGMAVACGDAFVGVGVGAVSDVVVDVESEELEVRSSVGNKMLFSDVKVSAVSYEVTTADHSFYCW